MVDVAVVGATEVAVDFNANVVTHSDGRFLHGIGGWQNCLFSKCTIVVIPSKRKTYPIILDKLTTVVGPGELIDVVITEIGMAINPKRTDLIQRLKGSNLPVLNINDLKAKIDQSLGHIPKWERKSDDIVAIVKWVDGTVIDSIYKFSHQ